MNRRTFLAAALAGAAVSITRPDLAHAQGTVQLTDAIRGRLAALPAIRDGVDPAKYFDGTPLLLSFWASWCPPCTAEFNEISDFIAKHGPDLVRVIAINWLENAFSQADGDDLRRYARRFIDPSIAVVTGSEATGADFGGVPLIPAVFLFDGAGNQTYSLASQGGHGSTFMRARDLEIGLGLTT